MTSLQWNVRRRSLVRKETNLLPTDEHPLKNYVVTERISKKFFRSQTNDKVEMKSSDTLDTVSEFLDPLREFALSDADPFSRMQTDNSEKMRRPIDESVVAPSEIWNIKKNSILNKYTTANKITITSSYLPDDDNIVVRSHNTVVNKVQNRLEQLNWGEELAQKRMEVTQAEYINKIDSLNKELVHAWNSEQRVKAVKIAIQCAKLLADTDVMSFYPSKFVLITEILDIFGRFVYERLKHMAETKISSNKVTTLPENFSPDSICDSAKETCLNWFHKIASIRELVPRLYVELAIIRSYNFISTTEGYEALLRITNMINGIGNPLVATYARCYLCRVGQTLPQHLTDNFYVLKNLQRIIETQHHVLSQEMREAMKKEEISFDTFLDLFSPALNFIMEIIVENAQEKDLDNVFQRCQRIGGSFLVLHAIISVFNPNYVANRTVEILEMVSQCADHNMSISNLLSALGNALGKCPPPADQRKPILRNIGMYSNSFEDLDEYMGYVEAWMPFVAKNFKVREVNALLGDIIKRVSAAQGYVKHLNQLKHIMKIIVVDIDDFESIFTVDNFLPFLDLFQQDSSKVEVCKMILTCYKNENEISDPVVISTLSFLCTILHDSVDALTPEDELRQIGLIISNVIRKIDYGRDFEQQLNFHVEARGSFANIDSVLIELILKTNTLMIKTREIMQGFHSRKTADFVRACAAYCFITIPSLTSSKARLELYLLSGQVALFNQCLGQADSCFRAVLSTIPEFKNDNGDESYLVSFVKKFLSVLLVAPDNPDSGVVNILRSLLNILRKYEWNLNGTSLLDIYLSVLDVLSVMTRPTLPYHIDKVESNDTLYGNDEKFIQEINKICTIILAEILSQLKAIGSSRKQSALMLDLFIRIIDRCELREPTTCKLALSIWQQCSKHGFIDKKFLESTRSHYKLRSLKTKDENMKSLLENLA